MDLKDAIRAKFIDRQNGKKIIAIGGPGWI
jgi:hypothetical protein